MGDNAGNLNFCWLPIGRSGHGVGILVGTTNTVVLVDYCVCTRITNYSFVFLYFRFTVGLFFTRFNFYNFYFLQPSVPAGNRVLVHLF